MKSGTLIENNKEYDIIISLNMKEVHLICDMMEAAVESNKKKTSWKAMLKRWEGCPDQ